MSLPSLGLLSSGVSILEGNPIGQSIRTGLQIGGLNEIEEDKEEKLYKDYLRLVDLPIQKSL